MHVECLLPDISNAIKIHLDYDQNQLTCTKRQWNVNYTNINSVTEVDNIIQVNALRHSRNIVNV